jgi:hypothetical protein
VGRATVFLMGLALMATIRSSFAHRFVAPGRRVEFRC